MNNITKIVIIAADIINIISTVDNFDLSSFPFPLPFPLPFPFLALYSPVSLTKDMIFILLTIP